MTTDTKTPGDKTLSVSSTKTLTLKPRVETGVVRQSFSHGRTKAVVVEKVKRRIGPGEAKAPEPAPRRAGSRRDAAPRRRRRARRAPRPRRRPHAARAAPRRSRPASCCAR